MKKGKLNTEDGSEFTVFYLKQEQSQINKQDNASFTDNMSDFFGGPNKVYDGGVYDPPFNAPTLDGPCFEPMAENPSDFSDEPNKGNLDEDIQELLSQDKLFWGSELEKKQLKKKAKQFFTQSLQNHLGITLDDTIESDIVKEPVKNEIYRVKGLNKMVRYIDSPESATLVSMTKNTEERVWKVEINKDIYFYLSPYADMLLKATDSEKERFINNESL